MDKKKLWAGFAAVAVMGALGFAFAASARASETGGGTRSSKSVPREMPESVPQLVASLKQELAAQLEKPQQKYTRPKDIISHLGTTAMAWHQTAPEIFEIIKTAHTDPRKEVRREAAFELGFLGEKMEGLEEPAMEMLMKMAGDEDAGVRRTVTDRIGALGLLKGKHLWIDARTVLDRLRQGDRDEKVQQAAEKHFAAISRLHLRDISRLNSGPDIKN